MRQDDGFSAGAILLSFVLGGIVGAGVAMLLAPQSGIETRKKIRDFVDDVSEKATDYASHTREKVMSTVEKGKDFIDEKKAALATAFEAGKEAFEREVRK
ncbi:MAG TPA: YtxH domain-containing protein [Nitrospirae bacterium]|nr:YtxH domain-containing protein [Nitrospirota bacterium]